MGLQRLDETEALPWPLEVDLVAAERRDRGAEGSERDLLEHRLDAIHRVAEVGVRLQYHSSIVNSGWCLYETLSLRKSLPISYTRSSPPTIRRFR